MLVLVRIDLDLVDQFLVDQLVLVNQHQQTVQLTVELFVLVQSQEVGLPQPLLLGDDLVEVVLLASDPRLALCDLGLELLAPCEFVAQIGGVVASLCLVLLRLPQHVVIRDLVFTDLSLESSQLVLGPSCVLCLVLQFPHQLLVVIFRLSQGFVELGIDRLAVPRLPLQRLQLRNVLIQQRA